ncbi:MAG: hypothetical protein ABI210_06400, partial [Abditibacteriaceae bacterium]
DGKICFPDFCVSQVNSGMLLLDLYRFLGVVQILFLSFLEAESQNVLTGGGPPCLLKMSAC